MLIATLCTLAFVSTSFESAPIFPPQDKHVHSSSIVELPNGDLLATWFHGSGERSANDVVVQGARKPAGANEWSQVFLLADTPNLPDCNPVLFVDANDRLWLFWVAVQSNRWENAILKYRRTTDYTAEGAPVWNWQDIILLAPGDEFPKQLEEGFETIGHPEPMWAEYAHAYTRLIVDAAKDPVKRDTGWMTRTLPLTLSSGRILLPLYSDGFNVSLMAYSDDHGETWLPSEPIVGLGNIQPSIVESKDGTVTAFMRDNGAAPPRIMRATSDDGGVSWSIASDMDIPNPGSSVAVTALADGRWILICNDTEDGRHRLSAYMSEDEGQVWAHRRVIEESAPGEGSYGYPTVMADQSGRIQVTYTHSGPEGKTIAHASFSPEWIAD